jgi:hypothetical protein
MRIPGLILVLAAVLAGAVHFAGRRHERNIVHADTQPKWGKMEMPLKVYHHPGMASVDGFWQSVSSDKEKQLVWPIAVKITCDQQSKLCRELDATVQLGILSPDSVEYEISSWTRTGIVADDSDECNRHSLSIDFNANSVTVTDYPIKQSQGNSICKPLHEAYSYSLHGGELSLYPPPPWNPLEGK